MLKLLLDEHVAPAVATGLRQRRPAWEAYAMPEWQGGFLLGKPDEICLSQATTHGLTLVTFDLRTFPTLLESWFREGRSHAGAILCDDRTIQPWEVGQLVRALEAVCLRSSALDWTNRVEFLRRA
ncbi:MAG: DUF5615 family PIN-like protein [Terracidiphilus sp.]